ncbi:MAG: hypothetical protein LAO08_09070 [Acidobacteriia bacterium]|nr:hypothetical protein [Terriglobia bacterium]
MNTNKDEEFGHRLLAAIEKQGGQNPVMMNALRDVVRDALGIPTPPSTPPNPPQYQLYVPPEFPQYRIKYSAEGIELDRKYISSPDDLGRLFREDYKWASASPVPAEKE